MEPIYVTGHRNPDTDSIVSAMAYAALRNALGDREFVPARLGHISDETRLVLDRFGFEPPVRIQTMRTQVRDLDYDTPPALSGAVLLGLGIPAVLGRPLQLGQPGLGGTADQQGKIHPRYPRDERKRRAVRDALSQRDRELRYAHAFRFPRRQDPGF